MPGPELASHRSRSFAYSRHSSYPDLSDMSAANTPLQPSTSATPVAAKTNGTHKKSRNGCLVCKKRRVKCDEGRPQCKRCAVGRRHCEYTANESRANVDNNIQETHRISPIVRSVAARSNSGGEPFNLSSASTSLRDTRNEALVDHHVPNSLLGLPHGFTILHMRLLYHAITHMASYMALESDVGPIIDYALQSAHTAPYVLSQLLALSALHCSFQQPENAETFQYHATDLQTRALGAYSAARDSASDPERASVQSFIFASLLGIHVLHNCLSQEYTSVSGFVAGFVGYLRIHRGIRSVIGEHWDAISESHLKPLLYVSRWIVENESSESGVETAPLRALLQASPDQASSSVQASLRALHYVQWMLDLKATVSSDSVRRVHVTLAWPLVVPDDYVECLYQHRPEALAVLAFFAAALHQQADFWGFSNAGCGLVRVIAEHIGSFWGEALAWPLGVVENANV